MFELTENRTMKLIMIFLVLVNLINVSIALVCPIYSSRKNSLGNHRYLIKKCQENCSYSHNIGHDSSCLGIYYNYSGEIYIKQLGTISSDEQCVLSKECILETDPLDAQTHLCCCSSDNCTLKWEILLTTTTTTTLQTKLLNTITIKDTIYIEQNYFPWRLSLFIFSIIMIIMLVLLAVGLWLLLKSNRNKDNNKLYIHPSSPSTSSSSLLEQLFFSLQKITQGRNSEIYKGNFNDEIVVLKVYEQSNMSIWKNEVSLLKSVNHESIIKLLSDGQHDTHLYLILPYYENGTIQSYLSTSIRKLSISQCLTFLRSIASAVSYLHCGRNDNHMTIIHRDIKSSNIFVCKNQMSLCLADFGVALHLPTILSEQDFVQIGTLRYMAPELLEGVIAHTREALCSVDMYALALVMWEIVTQCESYPKTNYRAPYDEYLINVHENCSLASQIHDIVVIRQLRPTLNRPMKDDKQHSLIINELCSLIEQCWITDSDIRMNSQTLTLKLNQLME